MAELEPEAAALAPAAAESDGAGASPPASGEQEPSSPVAAALEQLNGIGERDLAEHPDVYQRIHGELQRALSAIDDA